MLSVDYPWVFLLLPAPLLAYWLLPRAQQLQSAVRVPFFDFLSALESPADKPVRGRAVRLALLGLLWLCLLCSAAGPTWLAEPISLPSSGRDLLLAVDISGSMRVEDMQQHGQQSRRIDVVKTVLEDFIQQRTGDRLGLVLFGSQAYVQAPLTFDRATVRQFLEEAEIGFAGEQNTAIGDAIGLSVKRLRQRPGDRHVMILLTDGNNNGGEVKPIPAAEMAAKNHIVIYTVGIGADEMVLPGLFGGSFGERRVNPSADLDEATLQEVAKLTGGRYFRARTPDDLSSIYQLLDQLEPVEDETETFRPQKALFYWPLALALIISAAAGLLQLPWPSLGRRLGLRQDLSEARR